MSDLTEFTLGYVEAMLWCGVLDDDEVASSIDDFLSIDDIESDTLEDIKADCKDFYESNLELLKATGMHNYQMLGHDFYLTRNGHGTGFWDRGYPGDSGEKLTEASEPYGSFSLMFCDDGKLYGMNG